MEERLQKFMARCGIASRRKCEEFIADGRVTVNGRLADSPGIKVDPAKDRIMVDGKRVGVEKSAYFIHYKTRDVTTTVSDDLGRKTVMDCLPEMPARVFPVGRLDRDSEGLLVFTNDGALANYLTHPAYGVEKTYRVVAEGRIEEETLKQLRENGIRLGPVLVKPTEVTLVRHDNEKTIVLVSVAEGINREVRRVFAALGHEVKRLLRIQLGPLTLEGMKRGSTRPMTEGELRQLRKGMGTVGEVEDFPAGSAKERKPAGPRGRRKPLVRAPRLGKPDPALAQPGHEKKFSGAPDPARRRRGESTFTSSERRPSAYSRRPDRSSEGKRRSFDDTPRPGKYPERREFGVDAGRPRQTMDGKKRGFGEAPRGKYPERREFGGDTERPRKTMDGKKRSFGDTPRPGKYPERREFGADAGRPRKTMDGKKRSFGDTPRPGKYPERREFGADAGRSRKTMDGKKRGFGEAPREKYPERRDSGGDARRPRKMPERGDTYGQPRKDFGVESRPNKPLRPIAKKSFAGGNERDRPSRVGRTERPPSRDGLAFDKKQKRGFSPDAGKEGRARPSSRGKPGKGKTGTSQPFPHHPLNDLGAKRRGGRQ